ncbi:MAG: MarR family transcriptional regulator [Firmicutes bacterium]|nr:MarR family transcriptional regulator [Bacillota bacterium]
MRSINEKEKETNVMMAAFGLARAIKRRPPRMEHALHPAAEHTLMVIAENDGLSSGELCELLDVRPSSVSEIADKMAARGFVEKKDDETDKRVTRIFLTELGQAQAKQIADTRQQALDEFSACFTEEEAAQFCALANKLSAHLKELAAEDPEGSGCGCHKGHHGPAGGCHRGPHGHHGPRFWHRH